MLSEFGRNLGWKYIFWDKVEGFISPLEASKLRLCIPKHTAYLHVALPVGEELYSLAGFPGSHNKVLFIAGFWGQVDFKPARSIIERVSKSFPDIQISVVCGTNSKLADRLNKYFRNFIQVKIYGQVSSIAHLLRECASIISKPGFSTLSEAYVAKRKIFLLKGMPVAEDNNAGYAIENFSAEWFSLAGFRKWYYSKMGEVNDKLS